MACSMMVSIFLLTTELCFSEPNLDSVFTIGSKLPYFGFGLLHHHHSNTIIKKLFPNSLQKHKSAALDIDWIGVHIF